MVKSFVSTKLEIIFIIVLIIAPGWIYPQNITVTSPNGGEILIYGDTYSISWTSNNISQVTIEYSINGGLNWITISNNVPSPGNFTWFIPNSPTTLGLVRVRSGIYNDLSNSVFFIQSPQFSPSDTIKILPIGNSITFDSFRAEMRFAQDKISYRAVLWDSLRINNYNFDFIGHKLGGYYQFPDPNCNGIPGISDDQEVNFLSTGYDPVSQVQVTPGNYLNYFDPNIILLHIGTNGVNDPGGTSAADVQNILNLIDAKSQDIWVVLSLIIDMVPNSPNVTAFNNNIKNLAQQRINNGDKILLINMQNDAGLIYVNDPTPPYSGDMFDGLHPNDSGKKKMADLWFKALKLIMPNSNTSAPSIYSIPDTLGYVGFPYRYDVNASGVGAPNYLFISSPSHMSINTKTGIIDWIPTSVGSYSVSVKAVNSSGEDIQIFNIQVKPQPSLTNNIVSYWPLDENDVLNRLTDLPGVNDAFLLNNVSLQQGIVNNALRLSGSSRVDILDDTSLYFYPNENFSIEMWVKTSQSGSGEKIFIGKNGGYTKYYIGLNSSNQVKFEIEDSTGAVTNVVGPTINDGNWHHIAGVLERQNNRLRIYVDGIRYSTVKMFHPSGFFSFNPLTIGYFEYSKYFNGLLDEIAIYNRALTQAEILDHYERGINFRKGYFDKFVLVKVKVFLDGPYHSDGDTMSTKLRQNNLIPLTSPYVQDPRTVDSIPSGVVDWVLLELRNTVQGGDIIGFRSAFLKSNGMIVGDDGISEFVTVDVPPGNYYIVVRHRNHLSVMSPNSLSLDDNSSLPVLFNFTDSSNKYYGTSGAKELEEGIWGMWAGDINSDGVIKYNLSGNDRALILQRIGGSDINAFVEGYYSEDLNFDGKVKYNLSNNDRAIILINVGSSNINASRISQVP